MTDEPKTPPRSTDTQASESDDTSRAAKTISNADDKARGSAEATAGTLPPPPDADLPRPTPESQAALTGKAPSGSSDSGTTVPAAGEETEAATKAATPSKARPASAPPPNETPEEKKACLERIIAEARAK